MSPKEKTQLVEKLRSYLTLQLFAYQEKDWDVYDKLEERIRRIERQL